MFEQIDSQTLSHLLEQDRPILVDVRTEAEVRRGIIAGALHVPLHTLPMRVDEFSQERPLVLYCQSGGRSGQACMFLASRGYRNLYNLSGGILGWVRSGGELSAPEV